MSSKPKKLTVKETKVETETLLALATSDTVTQAAEKLNINRTTLYERIAKYGLTDQLKDIQNVAKMELLTGAGKAARNLVDKIDHSDPNISLKSSTEVLDRIGATKDNSGNTVNISFNQVVAEMKDKYAD